ncbi:MAG: SprT family zinc-dependent metalloprotease [Burkholderiaceae bacterium]
MRGLLQLTLDFFTDTVASVVSEPNKPVVHDSRTQPAIEKVASVNPVATAPSAEPLAAVLRPVAFAHPRANREARLAGSIVAFELKRGKRKTIGFSVGADGLTVSAPRWVPLYEIDKSVQEKSAWIVKKLQESQERSQQLESNRIEWKDGTLIPFMGEQVIVVIDPRHLYHSADKAGTAVEGLAQLHTDAKEPNASLPGVPRLTLHISLPQDAAPERIRDAVQAWLMRQAKRIFQERLHHYAPQLKVTWTKLSLSSAGTRWGTAKSDGSIRLNWRLIHFSERIIDYVVVHELSHLRVMDHSPRFWSTVESIMPDYAALRGQLKDDAIPRWD